MKIKTVLISLSLMAFFFTSCKNENGPSGLYSGSTPSFELVSGEQSVTMAPFEVFMQFMPDKIVYGQQEIPCTVEKEDAGTLYLKTDFQLVEGIRVISAEFDREKETVKLILEAPLPQVTLEKYDEMIARKVAEYAPVQLTSDLSGLSENQLEMLTKLFQVAEIMEQIYWKQAYPDRESMLESLSSNQVKQFFMINYGPWERLNNDLPFIPEVGPKPSGSGFYPVDMTVSEFEDLADPAKTSLYTLIRRDETGKLVVVPYHEAYSEEVTRAAALLREAAALADNKSFAHYLELRAEALLTDDYYPSDMAWMDVKDNMIDFVAGPIENYEDALFNYKAAHESFILIRDREWSEKLAFIAGLLPELQKGLPVPDEYKKEVPGSDSDLGAYDVVFYAGDCNAGSKTIAINLPNDEKVQAAKGSRKLQLKNAIRYKFEQILVPISNVLIAEDQRSHVRFDAFFENTMFHEVAHGLGLNHTINGKGTVREALLEQSSALEEGKADVLGLYLVTKLAEMGQLGEKDLMDNYVTFMAGIFRSVRFGASSSHGKANMIRFYYFEEQGAFTRDEASGTYRINFEKMKEAVNNLANLILTIQGNGDYAAAKALVDENGYIREALQKDLDRLKTMNIPVDIVFEQGPEVLGL
ncbi:MAG: dipeptidyl-peptidase 3 family protein [Bacteroidota bacterium]